LKTLVFVGPPGSGKTTLAGNTFRSGLLTGKKIYIINDDGDGSEGTVDAGILRGIEGLDLNALTAGCIGCKDEAEFREAIRQIRAVGNVDWLVIEPVGYAAGNEVPSILHSVGIHATVICLVDVANFADNFVDGFMPTQVKAASVIGLTKYGDAKSIEDSVLEEVIAFIGEHNSEAPVFLLPSGGMLPEWTLHSHAHHHGHVHDHSCDHVHHEHHEHHHDGDHGVYSIHLKLRLDIGYADIQRIAVAIPGIFRGKGVAGGHQWHLVQRTWSPEHEQLPDDRAPFATFYSREPLAAEDFTAVAVPAEDVYAGKDIKQILRTSTVSAIETENAIRRRLQKFPAEAFTNRFGDLVTHPEVLSITKELARRGGVTHEVFAEVIRRCTVYWLSAKALLDSNNWDNNPGFNEWQRALGTSLGYYGYYHSVDLGGELMMQVVKARPAHLLFAGLSEIKRLNSDFAKAKLQAEEARDIAKFGLTNEGMTKAEILPIMRRCLEMAQRGDRHNIAIEWHNAFAEVENFDV